MNKNGKKCIRPWVRDEVLLAKGNTSELFERGGKVNKDTDQTEKEMVKKRRNQQMELNTSDFFFPSFLFCSLPAKAFCPVTPVHFLAEKSHNTSRAHLVVSVDECETNHVNCVKKQNNGLRARPEPSLSGRKK